MQARRAGAIEMENDKAYEKAVSAIFMKSYEMELRNSEGYKSL